MYRELMENKEETVKEKIVEESDEENYLEID